MDAFGQALQQACDADLVHRFAELPVSHRPDMDDAGRISLHSRARRFDMIYIAAAHNGQFAVFGARLPAGDRRVHKTDALLAQRRVKLARKRG